MATKKDTKGGGREPASRMKPAPQLPVNPDRDKKPQQRKPAPGIPVPRRKN